MPSKGSTQVTQQLRPAPLVRCDGKMFADFVVAGTYFLRKYRCVINDLNVFPVPDGDTGTNMFFTVRSAMLAARRAPSQRLADVAAAAAQGALMGARGNSGVIMSQMFRGFAQAVHGRDFIETRDLAQALEAAVRAARLSLSRPVEGTIISVAAAAASSAARPALEEADFYAALQTVVAAANAAVEKTPEQLESLRLANIVDAGGLGFLYFLEGVLRLVPGGAPYGTAFPQRASRRTTFSAKQRVEQRRFCTEFMVAGASADATAMRDLLSSLGDSLIVAPGDDVLRVHIHTDHPHEVMDVAARHGMLSRTKIENMEEQHNVLVVDRESKRRGSVCVVPGDGFATICRELGADVTIAGGATKHPSVQELLAAVNNVLAPVVYLFANDKNVVPAANEVVRLAHPRVIVVPTTSVADGLAALLELSNHPDKDEPCAGALIAAARVAASGSIFAAGRDAAFDGVAVTRGELVGALDGRAGQRERIIKGADAGAIAVALVAAAEVDPGTLITLYYGSGREPKEADRIAATVRDAYPDHAVEVYYGGQTAADYVMSIER